MGYELKLVIVEPTKSGTPEYNDREKKTGRTEFYCQVIGQLDLCCFDGEAIETLDAKNIKQSKADKKNVYFYYETDGNTQVREDKYGAKRNPINIEEVLEAVKLSHREGIERDNFEYRRSAWAIGMLQSMVDFKGKHLQIIIEAH